MRALISLAVLTVAFASPAAAQWGMRVEGSSSGLHPRSFGGAGVSADWDRCTNSERVLEPSVSIESCDRLLAENRSRSVSGGIYWYRAMRHHDAGQIDLYEADLRRAGEVFGLDIEANPRSYDGYNNRAAVRTRLEEYEAALADYDRAVALESNADFPHLGRGSVLFRRGDFRAASEAFDRAARIAARMNSTGPTHHSARCEVRAALREDLERARSFCDRAVRNDDTPSYPLTSRGYYFFMQGDLDRAAADFARAVEEDPYNAAALYGRGVVAVRQGRSAEGEADMTRARGMDRLDVEYYANAGLTP